MPEFTVVMRRNVTEEAYVDVDAKDEKEAVATAIEQMQSVGLDGWEYVGSPEESVERVFAAENEDPDERERWRSRAD